MQLNNKEVLEASPYYINGKKTTAVEFKLADGTTTVVSAQDLGILINTRRLRGYDGLEDPIVVKEPSIDEPIDEPQPEKDVPEVESKLQPDGEPKKTRKSKSSAVEPTTNEA
jgi:hypothetical protein